MQPIGIKFLLKNNQYFLAVMTNDEARKTIHDWGIGVLKGKTIKGTDGTWALLADEVFAMHLCEPPQTQQQQQTHPYTPPYGQSWGNKSGLN